MPEPNKVKTTSIFCLISIHSYKKYICINMIDIHLSICVSRERERERERERDADINIDIGI